MNIFMNNFRIQGYDDNVVTNRIIIYSIKSLNITITL